MFMKMKYQQLTSIDYLPTVGDVPSSYSTTHLLNYFKTAQKVKCFYDTTKSRGLLLFVASFYK